MSRYDDRGGREFQFTRLAADARRFVRLGSNRHVLAFRALGSADQTDSGSRVPFYLQSALGGSDVLRGFDSFRFRGANLMYFSGEYRFEVAPKVELALFYDAGKVFEDRKDFDHGPLETSWGAGLRLKSLKHVRIRVDVAKSREHIKAHVKFSSS
jgi:outer membrane protein assembly factor BamA